VRTPLPSSRRITADGGRGLHLDGVGARRLSCRAERERQEITDDPDAEPAEVRDVYAGKGLAGPLLDRVVDSTPPIGTAGYTAISLVRSLVEAVAR
jgi:hypothetical protein